jgi:NADPH-dependent ferric siderophore reductase
MAESLERFPRRAGVATVVARAMITPRMLRVTLRCEAFNGAWPISQPGEIITLLFTWPDEPIVLPEQGWRFPAGAPEQEWRNYTVRRHRPAAGEIDVDVVLHEPPGPASGRAAAAEVGSPVGFAGPRVDYAPRDGVDWLLLCGDETALPAIAAILETPPAAPSVLAVVEIADPDEEQPIALPPGGRVEWVHRDRRPAATTTHLADAVRSLALPPGAGQAWGAAESKVARDPTHGPARRARHAPHARPRPRLLAARGRVGPRRRLSRARDLDVHAGSPARGTVDRQRPVEHRDAVGQPA